MDGYDDLSDDDIKRRFAAALAEARALGLDLELGLAGPACRELASEARPGKIMSADDPTDPPLPWIECDGG